MLLAFAALAVLALGATAVSATTPVTIGQTDPGAGVSPGGPVWLVQTGVASGTDFVVPAGHWKITGWSTYSVDLHHGAQSMSMMVFRPDGSGNYTVVGESPVESLTPGSLNTFKDVNFAVQPGDRLGLYDPTGSDTVATVTDATGDNMSLGLAASEPAVGALVTPVLAFADAFRLDISATLTPALPTTKDDCKNNGWQTYTRADGSTFKNQGDCIQYVNTGK